MRCEIKGIYSVEAAEPCYLVEVVIAEHAGPVDLIQFTQAVPGQPRSNWQVPWDERLLLGTKDRWAFFFHYLDLSRPLLTPAGRVAVPVPTPMPAHLADVEYESPH